MSDVVGEFTTGASTEPPRSAAEVGAAPEVISGRWSDVWKSIRRSWSGRIGLFLSGLIILLALFAPLVATHPPNTGYLDKARGEAVRATPCVHLFGCAAERAQHLMGQDENGRDVFSRIVYGARVSLLAGAAAIVLSIIVGAAIGLVAGYFGKWWDSILMRAMDVLLSFPSLLLAILINTVLGKGLTNSVLAIGVVGVPTYARVVRGQVLSVREQDFVAADVALGVSRWRILRHRIFPNTLTPLIVQGTLGFATAVLEIAGLGFLGLGANPPLAEWGTMIASGYQNFFAAPHLVFFPGLMIFLNVIAFNLLGDALRDGLDPRIAKR